MRDVQKVDLNNWGILVTLKIILSPLTSHVLVCLLCFVEAKQKEEAKKGIEERGEKKNGAI